MSQYPVDEGIEIDAVAKDTTVYPWATMKVGDSFFVPLDDAGSRPRVRHLRSSIYNCGRSSLRSRGLTREDGYNVVVRKVTLNGVVGFRAWMVNKGEGLYHG